MRQIFKQASSVDFIYEAFGGIGSTANILAAQFPGALIRASDLDQKCCDIYNQKMGPRGYCILMDAALNLKAMNPNSSFGVVLDFNRLTLLDLKGRKEGVWKVDLLNETFTRKPSWVEVTDSAVCYLGTNWRRYGLASKSLEEYIKLFALEISKRWGYGLKTWTHHRAASYMLFEPIG